MQRGHVLLIAGGVLFAAGIAASAVWGAQFAASFMDENFAATQFAAVKPGESVTTTVRATDLSRPLAIAIHVNNDRSGGDDEGVRLTHAVRDPAGSTVSTGEFSSGTFTNFTPATTGSHTLTITNTGSRTVALDVAFGYLPFQNLQGDAWVTYPGISGVIAGGALVVLGILVIIAGAVVTAIDGRRGNAQAGSSAFSEGGITYRKD